jgi:hypothetical protein
VEWKLTSKIIVDGLTKSLIIQKYHVFVKMINIIDVKDLILATLGGHETLTLEPEEEE